MKAVKGELKRPKEITQEYLESLEDSLSGLNSALDTMEAVTAMEDALAVSQQELSETSGQVVLLHNLTVGLVVYVLYASLIYTFLIIEKYFLM